VTPQQRRRARPASGPAATSALERPQARGTLGSSGREVGAGDWIVLPEEYAQVRKDYPPDAGCRLIIGRNESGFTFYAFVRTKQPWEGPDVVHHDSHSGACESDSCLITLDDCRIDFSKPQKYFRHELNPATYSCYEPSQLLVTRAMRCATLPVVKTRKGRRR